ncbi:MAG TPA: hypothetical protein VKB49_31940 [Candidatus Sulfotelmatobacter sp.]|nr:hypothetical protein [Candidatus Sulfotelmatobacter sp.]
MKSNLPDRSLIREYLLGRLDNEKELEEQLSHDICFNDELSETVESIEEEIIEDFLDGTLDSADKDAVNTYFLRSPERKEKLRFARLLRNHFEEQDQLVGPISDTQLSAYTNVVRKSSVDRAAIPWWSHFKTYGQLAALVVLCIGSLLYISALKKREAGLESQLAQEREHSASRAKQAPILESSLIPLTLVTDRSRGDDTQIPHIEIKPSTRRIMVDIALQGHSPGPFDVHLETKAGNGPIWSARLLPLVSSSGDTRLVFDLPAQGMESDVYSFLVSSPLPGSGSGKHYDFRVDLAH